MKSNYQYSCAPSFISPKGFFENKVLRRPAEGQVTRDKTSVPRLLTSFRNLLCDCLNMISNNTKLCGEQILFI